MGKDWNHLLDISRSLTSEYGDAVFIGGVAVSRHAGRLGPKYQESSHDADFYLSFVGKAAMRDHYEMQHNQKLNKDSVLVEGEDLDVYVDRQHSLGVPYPVAFASSEVIDGIRVAAVEHLLILKLDAAKSRWASAKGDKDIRDLARIVALLDQPKLELLNPYLSLARLETLERVVNHPDLPRLMELNPHEGSKFRLRLETNLKAIAGGDQEPSVPPPDEAPPLPPPSPRMRRR